MERLKKNPFSTVLGLVFIIAGFVFLFVETPQYDLPLWGIGLMAACGLMLLFAKDKFIDIITLGLTRLVKDATKKNRK